jgi:hypothetical protein
MRKKLPRPAMLENIQSEPGKGVSHHRERTVGWGDSIR